MASKGTVRRGGISIEGDKALMSALRSLPEKVRRKISLAAVRAGAKPVISAAASAAPRESGRLQESIGAKTKAYRRGAEATIAVIGARKGFGGDYRGYPRDPRYYSHMVEGGTRPHLLPYLRIGGEIIRQWWRHPGARPKPFLAPAFDSQKQMALSAITAKLRQRLEKEAAKA